MVTLTISCDERLRFRLLDREPVALTAALDLMERPRSRDLIPASPTSVRRANVQVPRKSP
jgi:hypothetical protein